MTEPHPAIHTESGPWYLDPGGNAYVNAASLLCNGEALQPLDEGVDSVTADTFGVNTEAVGEASRQLGQIRSDMASLANDRAGYEGVTGSRPVEEALEHFFSKSSDNRENLEKLLERSIGILQGLRDGTASIDRAMADALQPSSILSEGQPLLRRSPTIVPS